MTEKTQKYPRSVYAAAGFSDLAAEKLRALPERVADLSERARAELSGGRGRAQEELADLGGRLGSGFATVRDRAQQIGSTLSEGDVRTDLRRFQQTARRRAGELANAAARNLATAQGRAAHVYDDLVARGATVLEGEEAPVAELPAKDDSTAEPPAVKPAETKKMAKKATRPVARKPSTDDES